MSKHRYQYYTDFFIDFNGKKHFFTICAYSVELSQNSALYTQLGISKKVSLGVAICNPVDEFDETIGKMLASSRAESGNIVMYANKKGCINTKVVSAFLMQEAQYIKNNPGYYIKGYEVTKKANVIKAKVAEELNNASPRGKEIYKYLTENIKLFKVISKYIK